MVSNIGTNAVHLKGAILGVSVEISQIADVLRAGRCRESLSLIWLNSE
jgi:hypothetical protein